MLRSGKQMQEPNHSPPVGTSKDQNCAEKSNGTVPQSEPEPIPVDLEQQTISNYDAKLKQKMDCVVPLPFPHRMKQSRTVEDVEKNREIL